MRPFSLKQSFLAMLWWPFPQLTAKPEFKRDDASSLEDRDELAEQVDRQDSPRAGGEDDAGDWEQSALEDMLRMVRSDSRHPRGSQ